MVKSEDPKVALAQQVGALLIQASFGVLFGSQFLNN